uniref:F-box domain-containing protein n=1 Tax=Steinernema glaseri TaxID=37863 RepID=A0A1I8AD33_9BILA
MALLGSTDVIRRACSTIWLLGWQGPARKLSKAVLKEISKTIRLIRFTVFENFYTRDGSRGIDADEELMPLLMRLEAPRKEVEFWGMSFPEQPASWFVETMLRYRQHLGTFTSVEFYSVASSSYTQLLEVMVPIGKLQSILILARLAKTQLPASFWVDYFFSESCTRLFAYFDDFDVVLGVINRWKQMDPRTLTPYKVFDGIEATADDLAS